MIDIRSLLEPITFKNISSLKPGDWIWDNKEKARRAHVQSIYLESVVEPIGFRQVHILDLDNFPQYSLKPFMLSNIDCIGFGSGHEWIYFEEDRFYKFKDNLLKGE